MSRSQRASAREWRQMIGGQGSSGLSVAAWCRQRGIAEASFYYWKRRLRSAAPAFVEMKRPDAPAAAALEMILPGERRLLVRRGFDHELLKELLGVLEGAA